MNFCIVCKAPMSLLGVPKDILRLIAQRVINITEWVPFALTCKACAEAVAWCRPFDVAAYAIRNNNINRMRKSMRASDHARLLQCASESGNVIAWYMLSQLTDQPCNISDLFIVRCQHDIETLQLAFQRASNPDQIVNCLRSMDGKLNARVYQCALECGFNLTITRANFIHVWPKYAHLIPDETCWQMVSYHLGLPNIDAKLEKWLNATGYKPSTAYHPSMIEWMLQRGYTPTTADGFSLPIAMSRNREMLRGYQAWVHAELAQHHRVHDIIAILNAVVALTPDEKVRLWDVRYIETSPQLFYLTDEELNCEVIRFPEVCDELSHTYHPYDFSWMGQFNTPDEVSDALHQELHNQHNICKLGYYESQQSGKKYAEFTINRMHLFLDKWIQDCNQQCEPMRMARLHREKLTIIAEECGDISDYESEYESIDTSEDMSADSTSHM